MMHGGRRKIRNAGSRADSDSRAAGTNGNKMTGQDRRISLEDAINKYSGTLENPDGCSDITGPCGDKMGFSVIIKDESITAIRFKATGCGVTFACGAAVAFAADGLPLERAMFISPGAIAGTLGPLPQDHRHCPMLAATAFYRAIADYLLKCEKITAAEVSRPDNEKSRPPAALRNGL